MYEKGLLEELQEEMKVSPLKVPEESLASRRILADGYQRKSLKQNMYQTREWKNRYKKAFLIFILLTLALIILIRFMISKGWI